MSENKKIPVIPQRNIPGAAKQQMAPPKDPVLPAEEVKDSNTLTTTGEDDLLVKEESSLETSPFVIKMLEENARLKEQIAERELRESASKPLVAVLTDKKPTTVKVQFIENHTFCINNDKFEATKGEKMSVEYHLANTFVQRKIAYIIN